MNYLTEKLSAQHDRAAFFSREASIDHYLRTQANQDQKKWLSVCFVHCPDRKVVKGYYTLSAYSVAVADLPPDLIKRWPKGYDRIPSTLIGRFGIDQSLQAKGFGRLLLFDALRRCFETSETTGSAAVILHPLNEQVRAFYEKIGFISFPGKPFQFISMRTLAALF